MATDKGAASTFDGAAASKSPKPSSSSVECSDGSGKRAASTVDGAAASKKVVLLSGSGDGLWHRCSINL